MDTLKNEGYIRVIANNEQFVPYCVINLEKKQGDLLKGIDNKTVRRIRAFPGCTLCLQMFSSQ